jgi:pimeloyl-ACP methyl ester carboxylesterase
LAKPLKPVPAPMGAVRTRRAYFDCKFGQLHVRTAFPGTGGFDEQVTLICLHSAHGSSREFARFLPQIADVRSVYAPDLPGCGESDVSPSGSVSEAAAAIHDLAADLRLRQIDVLGIELGAAVALELAALKPDLVRRLVLVGIPTLERAPVKQQALILRTRADSADTVSRVKLLVPLGKIVEAPEYAEDLFEAAPKTLASDIGVYLSGRA